MPSEPDQPPAKATPPNWEGFAELDHALAENRLTAYRMKKAWADPINRAVTILVTLVLLAYVGFVVINDFVL